jgi:hypothetical protein
MSTKLTQERLKELLHYDPDTGVFTWLVSRGIKTKAGDVAGNPESGSPLRVCIDYVSYPADRLAWLYVYGTYPTKTVRHVNYDVRDCSLKNLTLDRSETDLTAQRLRELMHYDPETGVLRWLVTVGSRASAGSEVGRNDVSHGYIRRTIDKVRYAEHRLVWLYMTGRWPASQIDHINGDRADNRWANLREATDAQNRQNMKKRRGGTSKYPGVCWVARRQAWSARITINYKGHHLGFFRDEEAAYSAYLKAKAELHTFQPVPREALNGL